MGTTDLCKVGLLMCVARSVAGLFLWLFFAIVSLLYNRNLSEEKLHTCIIWDSAANSQKEFTVAVANVTSAMRGSIKSVPSKTSLPDECIL